MFGKKRGNNGKKSGPAVHDDLRVVIDEHRSERHRFVASRPNQLWVGDIERHEALLNLAVVSREPREQQRRLLPVIEPSDLEMRPEHRAFVLEPDDPAAGYRRIGQAAVAGWGRPQE